MNIKDYMPGKRLKILMKGESGAGKSIQAGSFPNVYFFDFDGRIESVINYFNKLGRTDLDFDYYSVEEIEKAINKLRQWKDHGCPYQALVFDTITTITNAILDYIDKTKGSTSTKGGKESFGMKVQLGFISVAALDDYKFLLAAYKQMINLSKEIRDTHIIYNAHVMLKEKIGMDGSATPMRLVMGPPSVSGEIPIHFDEIYHLEPDTPLNTKDRAKRILLTDSTSMDFARTSYNLPRTMDVTDKLLYQQLSEKIPGLKEATEKKKEVKQVTTKSI